MDPPPNVIRIVNQEVCAMSHDRNERLCVDATPDLIHGLTFYQPEATLLALGEKAIDTRSWGTDYRGWVAIHSARETPSDWLARMALHPYAAALTRHALRDLPFGGIVAFGLLARTEVIASNRHASQAILERGVDFEPLLGDYTPGRRMWLFDRVVPLDPPIPHGGGRGLWHWTPGPEVRDRVRLVLGLGGPPIPATPLEGAPAWP